VLGNGAISRAVTVHAMRSRKAPRKDRRCGGVANRALNPAATRPNRRSRRASCAKRIPNIFKIRSSGDGSFTLGLWSFMSRRHIQRGHDTQALGDSLPGRNTLFACTTCSWAAFYKATIFALDHAYIPRRYHASCSVRSCILQRSKRGRRGRRKITQYTLRDVVLADYKRSEPPCFWNLSARFGRCLVRIRVGIQMTMVTFTSADLHHVW